MLQNVPQLALQIWYLNLLDSSNIIAVASAIFSGISILVTVLSMTMEKSLINQQEYTLIKMDVISKSAKAKSRFCKKRVNHIKRKMSEIVGLDKRLIEMIKPRVIPKGLRIECYLYVLNEESVENEYVKLFEEAKSDGSLAQCIHEAWKLSLVPNIINLKVKEIKSDQDTQRLMSDSIEMGEVVKDDMAKEDDLEDHFETDIETNNTTKERTLPRAITAQDSMIDDEIGEDDQ